ncbi:MAG: tRNA pseudouridine(38-40) synthase TruA [Leptospirales bacterium]
MKVACTVQYNGAAYFGFQVQKDCITVQEQLEKVLHRYFQNPIRITPAGRTDTGVHSVGQVIHFDLEAKTEFSKEELELAIYNLNSMLPRDISIIHADFVPDKFHARYSCFQRKYLYRVVRSDYRMAIHGNCLWVRHPLNVTKMEEAAQVLIGEHDFASFTKEIYSRNNEITIRRIDNIVIEENAPKINFYYSGSGFLHNMIRIITGTLLKVGKGEITPADIEKILHARTRDHIGDTLPPFPLIFLEALYEDYKTPPELLTV